MPRGARDGGLIVKGVRAKELDYERLRVDISIAVVRGIWRELQRRIVMLRVWQRDPYASLPQRLPKLRSGVYLDRRLTWIVTVKVSR